MGMFNKVANVQNVAPGHIAIITLPTNCTIDKLHLELGGGLTAAGLTRIEGKANGKTFFVDDGTKNNLRMAYKGIAVDAAYVTLDFTEANAKSATEQMLASLPANLLQSLTFEVTIDAAANALSTLGAEIEFRAPSNNPFIRKMIDFTTALQGAGDWDIYLPNGSVGGIIKRVFLHGTDKLTKWDLQVNRVSARYQTIAQWKHEQGQNHLVPQATMDVMDFMPDSNIQGALNTSADAKGNVPNVSLRLTSSAADSLHGYIEFVDPIGRI